MLKSLNTLYKDRLKKAEFSEELHPRDDNGKFSSGGGSGGGSEYADVKVGQKITAITGTEFKYPMTVTRVKDGEVYVKDKDGKEHGPFNQPLKGRFRF